MSVSLYDLLKRDVKKMVRSLGRHEVGNVYPLIMSEVEKYLLAVVLEETKNNYFMTAKVLGISRTTLYRKLRKLGFLPAKSLKK